MWYTNMCLFATQCKNEGRRDYNPIYWQTIYAIEKPWRFMQKANVMVLVL